MVNSVTKRSAIVTGGTGFIGKRLVRELVKRGWRVTLLARASSNVDGLPGDVRILRTDLDNRETLRAILPGTAYFFHLAGLTKARTDEEMLRINRDLTRDLALLCREHAGAGFRRFVFLSSQAASRPGTKAVCETDDCSPVSCYGRSKLEAEGLVRDAGLPFTIIRPPSVYGPGDRDIFFFFRLAHMGLVPIVGSRERLFSLIHVDDLVRGIIQMAENPDAENRTLFLTNANPISWGDFALTMQNISAGFRRRKPHLLHIPFPIMYIAAFFNTVAALLTGKPALLSFDKVREMSHSWVCDGGLAGSLGFIAEIPVSDGIETTYRWYLEQGWLR